MDITTRYSDPVSVYVTLVRTVTEYDRKQSTRKDYNRYALSMYMQACQSVNSYMREMPTHTARVSIVRYFDGRLLNRCLMAIGESPSTKEDKRG